MAHLEHAPGHREAQGKIKGFQSTHGMRSISRTVNPNTSAIVIVKGLTVAPALSMQLPGVKKKTWQKLSLSNSSKVADDVIALLFASFLPIQIKYASNSSRKRGEVL